MRYFTDFTEWQIESVFNPIKRSNIIPVCLCLYYLSFQSSGHDSLSNPADQREAQAGVWDREGAHRDHSGVFGHRGGAAGGTVWRQFELLRPQESESTFCTEANHPTDISL